MITELFGQELDGMMEHLPLPSVKATTVGRTIVSERPFLYSE